MTEGELSAMVDRLHVRFDALTQRQQYLDELDDALQIELDVLESELIAILADVPE